MSIAIDLAVEQDAWDAVPDLDGLIRRAVDAAAAGCGITLAPEAEVSILLCDDAAIQPLNRDWRGFDKPTNVLSFPAFSPLGLDRKPLLGDLAVALETVRREADQDNKTVPDHLSHLIVHGFLHLVGYDHEAEAEAEAMEALETRILAGLGIADPYAETDLVEAVAR
ncbi:rRNA maturation RNase YbeY [Lichenihabitans sp. Uapishka_5]|uniref:rRNA maturation RNase YbeY n=1 Tax=Lichenihabitans sp. Uapishka_5 TaxID=3037302 RepID=UPI0029E7CC2A|nr:rRNA maturation RNase YbeY [Lichenihabitans sp. Uapishka_5]MDX7950687.1 rRNA maturation RNase YbeY [Lichenihabitans sp. Uapishka_5]